VEFSFYFSVTFLFPICGVRVRFLPSCRRRTSKKAERTTKQRIVMYRKCQRGAKCQVPGGKYQYSICQTAMTVNSLQEEEEEPRSNMGKILALTVTIDHVQAMSFGASMALS